MAWRAGTEGWVGNYVSNNIIMKPDTHVRPILVLACSRPPHAAARLFAAAVLCLLALLGSRTALGHEPPAATGLGLYVERATPPGAWLDPQALRAAIEAELGASVLLVERPTPPGLSVNSRPAGGAAVTFLGPRGRTVERTLLLPAEPSRAVETLALLAASLARDEAAELIAELRARHRPSPPPPRVSPPPPPRPPPAPPPVAAPPDATPVAADAPDLSRYDRVPLVFEFVPFVGTATGAGRKLLRGVSLGLIGTASDAIDGIEASTLVNLDGDFVRGVQLSGGVNVVGGPVWGVQLAAGANVARGAVRGGQFSAGVNLAGGGLRGIQVASGFNLAVGPLEGAQFAPVNLTTGDGRGAQFGVVNVAGGTTGLQAGVVNVAEDAEVSLGLINVLWRGRTHLQLWSNESGRSMLGLQHGSRRIHNLYAVGLQRTDTGTRFAVALGLGAHWTLAGRLDLDVDLLVGNADTAHFDRRGVDVGGLSQLRALFHLRLLPGVALFAGPTYNVLYGSPSATREVAADPTFGRTFYESADHVVRGWPGLTAGLRLL